MSLAACQLALRTSVSSTSVTVITPGAGCSITSTATVSTTGVTGCFTFRAAFFTGVGLGFALATVRFAGSFPRFCTFARFLPLAMIRPHSGWCSATHSVESKEARPSPDGPLKELSTDCSEPLKSAACRQTTPAYEAASEHNPSLCSNPRLNASQPLRGRFRCKAVQVKASQCQLCR
jgi:hypothetical protein